VAAYEIGGLQFRVFLHGFVPLAGGMLEPFTRPGCDGIGYHDRGIHGETRPLVALAAFSSVGSRTTGVNQAMSLQGAIVSITDGSEVTTNHIAVLRVRCTPYDVRLDSAGELYHLVCEFVLQQSST